MARALVAMSGGVDSSVVAALLVREGHEVIGVTFNQWPIGRNTRNEGSGCCTPRTIDDARDVCRILDVPHYVLNFRREFEAAVVEPWAAAYLRGDTPNPCVMCNDRVRFPELIRKADELGADFVSTGHYARVTDGPPWRLQRAYDAVKDQSYVLYMLQQEQLQRIRLPIGGLSKSDVRDIATEFELPVADKPDSQEICFVPSGGYASVVHRYGSTGAGAIVDTKGEVVGRHNGLETVTVGQRRGLGLGGGTARRYVRAVDVSRNTAVVGTSSELGARTFRVDNVRWVNGPEWEPPRIAKVQMRSHGAAFTARLRSLSGTEVKLVFDQEVRAPATGQAAVFYRDDEVMGGGIIAGSDVS